MSANDMQVGGEHYKSGMQHWDLVSELGLDYYLGQASKYVTRWRKKNGLQDLKKALHFLHKKIELSEKKRGKCKALLEQYVKENELNFLESDIIKYILDTLSSSSELSSLELARVFTQRLIAEEQERISREKRQAEEDADRMIENSEPAQKPWTED